MSRHEETLDEHSMELRVSNSSTPYEKAEQRDMLDTVRQIVDSLPEKQKTCMQLRDFEGKQYKEIAAALSITEEQVKVNIYRARQAVKQKFNEKQKYGL